MKKRKKFKLSKHKNAKKNRIVIREIGGQGCGIFRMPATLPQIDFTSKNNIDDDWNRPDPPLPLKPDNPLIIRIKKRSKNGNISGRIKPHNKQKNRR